MTALHQIPNGEIWPYEEIIKVRDMITGHGMRWSIVESLPVSESIKYGGPDRDELIEKYKISLANLGKAGIKTVCYNFMPVLDWARTNLDNPNPDGTSNLCLMVILRNPHTLIRGSLKWLRYSKHDVPTFRCAWIMLL